MLKVTNSPKNSMDNVPSKKDANDAMLEKNQCDVFGIPSKLSKSTNKKPYVPMSVDLPVVAAILCSPWVKKSMQVSND